MVEVQFPESGLSAEYGDIIIGSVAESVTVSVTYSGDIVISEIYTPDSDGKIYIHDIGKIAVSFQEKQVFKTSYGFSGLSSIVLTVAIVGATTITKAVTIYKSVVDFAGSLDVDTLKIIPLSRMTKKITGPGRKEYISFYGGSTVSVYVVKKGITQDEGLTISYATLYDAEKIYFLDVSPDVVAGWASCDVSDLIYYNVYTSTDAIIRFTVDHRNFTNKRTFVFRNCFGAQESFTCTGDEESSRKWAREYGVSQNKQVQISNDLVNSIKVNTGIITSQQVESLEDLLNTDQLALLDEYGFQPIVILEENFSNNSRRDELKSVDFTYRFAGNNQFRTNYAAFKKPRIFDPTFDETFN